MPQPIDLTAAVVAVLSAAALATAITVLWKPIRKVTRFTDLITRELTGWRDEATGEAHPSLRAEIHEISSRLEGFIARITEDISDLHQRVLRLENEFDALKDYNMKRKGEA